MLLTGQINQHFTASSSSTGSSGVASNTLMYLWLWGHISVLCMSFGHSKEKQRKAILYTGHRETNLRATADMQAETWDSYVNTYIL